MRQYASHAFWNCYNALPERVRELADKNFSLLKTDPRHPSLRFKKVGRFYSVRVGRSYRALGLETPDGVLWFWTGSHTEYDKIIG